MRSVSDRTLNGLYNYLNDKELKNFKRRSFKEFFFDS